MYKATEISNWILSQIIEGAISPLKLQKLLYYCQAWHLTLLGKRLINEDVEAWTHGPVFPSQYTRFEPYLKSEEISNDIDLTVPEFNKESLNVLKEILIIYGTELDGYLEFLSHSEEPWIGARGSLEAHELSNNIITNKAMVDFYSKFKEDE